MADQSDLDFTYTTLDKIFRLSIGETGDFSGAKYDGNFSLSLEEAQRAKHNFIADQLNIGPGTKVLDMGCGWGGFIHYATRHRRADCLGLTLSQGQARACRKSGLKVLVKDCRTVTPDDYGRFDAVVSLGAFEHFCSVEEWKAGEQEQVYHRFFKTVADLLPNGGRFFLQTMVFSKNMIDYEAIDINAKKGSAPHVMALLLKEFPGSWLPYGAEMVEKTAAPYFQLISKSSGRLDYIETMTQWRKKFRKFNLKKYALYVTLIPRYLTDKAFRHQVQVVPNRVCFEREIMDHYRFVFEKV
jgi:cyclopropane-fatty-acyl-phospholipid synthase